MWTKIYLTSLIVCIVVVGSISFYGAQWLQSVGNPADALAGFERSSQWSWPLLWITAAALLLIANGVLWSTGRSWTLWATFCYFAVFLFINALWLAPAARNFSEAKGLTIDGVLVGPFVAAIMILLGSAIVFLDQFIVTRTREKTYPPTPIEPERHDVSPEDKE